VLLPVGPGVTVPSGCVLLPVATDWEIGRFIESYCVVVVLEPTPWMTLDCDW
jgi:hypothetical protein